MNLNWVAGTLKLIPLIISAVAAVEKVASAAKGKQKQDAAVDFVAEVIPIIESGIDREVINEDLVQDALRKVIDAVVALMNVVRDAVARRAAATAGR